MVGLNATKSHRRVASKDAGVARSDLHFLIALVLAAALLALAALAPDGAATVAPSTVRAQAFPDPGFGDPYAAGNYVQSLRGMGGNGSSAYMPSNYGTGAPVQPTSPERPVTWPGGSQDPAKLDNIAPQRPGNAPPTNAGGVPSGYQTASAVSPLATNTTPKKSPADPPYDPAEIVAVVGSEVIQANELLPQINQAIANIVATRFSELPSDPASREEQLNILRKQFMKQSVEDLVKIKLLLNELHRKVPADALKKPEKQIRDAFNKSVIPRLLEMNKAKSVIDLENKYRDLGSSLDAQRTVYVEREMAFSWLHQQVKDEDHPPTHEEMLAYYRDHIANWETPPRVRWEQLTVKFVNFGSKPDAYRSLARWGTEVWNGAPFGDVAKAHSQDFASTDGGVHEWTGKGSLRSVQLDDALFALPEGKLSQIIEDDEGFHIVRVLGREDAKRTPFSDVQVEIKTKLQTGGKDKQRLDYIAKLREVIPVTTVFDEENKAAGAPTGPATPSNPPANGQASAAPAQQGPRVQ